MSQLLQVRTITEVIDSRIAQFSSGAKEFPATTPSRRDQKGCKVPAKLKPLDYMPGLRTQAEDFRATKTQLSPLPKSRATFRSTTFAIRKSESKQEPPQLNNSSESSVQIGEVKEEKALEHWITLLAAVLEKGHIPISLTSGYRNLKKCVNRLKFTVRFIEKQQKQYIEKQIAAVTIQSWVKGFQQKCKFVKIRYSVCQIQRYWRQVCQPTLALQRVKRAVRLLTAWWR
jgi:hypothetical protein